MPTPRQALILGASAALTLAAVVAASPAASAAPAHPDRGAVFALDDALAGNHLVAYRRAADGTLQQSGVSATGGLGGRHRLHGRQHEAAGEQAEGPSRKRSHDGAPDGHAANPAPRRRRRTAATSSCSPRSW